MAEEMTAIQIPKRVHRRLRAVCVILDIPIGRITESVMQKWTDKELKRLGLELAPDAPDKYPRTESSS